MSVINTMQSTLAILPFVFAAADNQSAIFRDNEQEVTDNPRIGETAMGEDESARRTTAPGNHELAATSGGGST